MKKLNTKNPFQPSKDLSKPQKVIFTCDCRTLRAAIDLRSEINFRVREMGYINNKDFKCEIEEVINDNK